MEENNQNLIQATVQSPSGEHPNTLPINSDANKPKSRLPILMVGIVVILLLAGVATAAFIFLPKSEKNQEKHSEIAVSPKPTVTQEAPITSAPTNGTANWKIARSSFADFKIPPEWNLWKCNETLYIIADWGAQSSESDGCPFDGPQAVFIHLSQTPYNTVESAIPKTENIGTQTITISDIQNRSIDGKIAVQWKRAVTTNPGQEELQGVGKFIELFIMPNITISANEKDSKKVEKMISTMKITQE